jgi:hypothetical protein
LEGSGAGRTPNSFKDFSYSANKAFNLSTISEILLSEDSLCSDRALSRSWIHWSLLLRDLAKSALLARRSSTTFVDLS